MPTGADPTTLEVLDQLVAPRARVAGAGAHHGRPEFTAALDGFARDDPDPDPARPRPRRRDGGAPHRGEGLPAEVLAQILARTDGVPLFVEELTKTILESGLLREMGDRYALTGPLPPLAIPATVQDSLMARLDRLAPVKEVAQLGAVLGREFSYALLAAVSPLGRARAAEALEQLVGAGLCFAAASRPMRTTASSTPSCKRPPTPRC